ncbi:MAG: hypothetical protein QOF84_5593 [Streptomyces sp.]|jgi:hypothetical protein|nr:hypothetical protein [Streptomyces sp.]MDX6350803.1 hypothetical protein [Streptomyces sp.]
MTTKRYPPRHRGHGGRPPEDRSLELTGKELRV